jgi:O-antigen ligase
MFRLTTLTPANIVLYGLFASLNFEVGDPFHTGGVFSVTKLLGWIYVVTMLPQFKGFLRPTGFVRFLAPLGLFFGLFTAMNVFNSPNGRFAVLDFVSLLQNILLFGLLILHARKQPAVLKKGMLWFALGAAVEAGLFRAGIGVEEFEGRITLFGDNANGIGLRMGAGMTILVLTVLQDRLRLDKPRFLFLACLPFMLALLVATGSRVALIAAALTLLTGTILLKTKGLVSKIAVLALALILASGFLVTAFGSDVLLTRLAASVTEKDLGGREQIWASLLPLIARHPLLGCGQTGYAEFVVPIYGWVMSPHNVFLEVMCYTGIVGFSFFLWFLWQVFRSGWRGYRAHGLLLPLLLWIPVVGCLLSGQVLVWKFVWCIFAYNVGGSLGKPLLRVGRVAALPPQLQPVMTGEQSCTARVSPISKTSLRGVGLDRTKRAT